MNVELIWIIAATAAVIWFIIWDAKAVKSTPEKEDPLAECSCSAM